jgi:hypothetical protein
MSYICDVCGPRLDCHSILCQTCDMGIIFEIHTKDDDKPAPTSDVYGSDSEREKEVVHA